MLGRHNGKVEKQTKQKNTLVPFRFLPRLYTSSLSSIYNPSFFRLSTSESRSTLSVSSFLLGLKYQKLCKQWSETNMAGQNGIYLYEPSLAAAIIAAIAFGTSAVYHLIQMIRKRAWFYSSLTVGAFSKGSNKSWCPLSADKPQ